MNVNTCNAVIGVEKAVAICVPEIILGISRDPLMVKSGRRESHELFLHYYLYVFILLC